MCIICDGGTYDEALFDIYGLIQAYGYMVNGVEGSRPWTYTIGLAERGHPELAVTGLPFDHAAHLVNSVANLVCAGRSFSESSPPLAFDGLEVRFGPVHPGQWEQGRFDWWLMYYDWLGDHGRLKRDAIQILWPDKQGRYPTDKRFCCIHADCQPLLDHAPTSNVNVDPDRDSQRIHARGDRRRRHSRRRA